MAGSEPSSSRKGARHGAAPVNPFSPASEREVSEWEGFVPPPFSRVASFSSPITLLAFPLRLFATVEEVQNQQMLEELVLKEVLHKHMPLPHTGLLSSSKERSTEADSRRSTSSPSVVPPSSFSSPWTSPLPAATMARYAKRRRERTPEREGEGDEEENDSHLVSRTTILRGVTPPPSPSTGSSSQPVVSRAVAGAQEPSTPSSSTAPYYCVVNVKNIQLQPFSSTSDGTEPEGTEGSGRVQKKGSGALRMSPVDPSMHSNDANKISLRVQATLTLVQVMSWGMCAGLVVGVGVASVDTTTASPHTNILQISIPCTCTSPVEGSDPTTTTTAAGTRSSASTCSFTVLAKLSASEVASAGQAVWVCWDAGGIFCMGVRVPRVARGDFLLKGKREDGFTLVEYREVEGQKKN